MTATELRVKMRLLDRSTGRTSGRTALNSRCARSRSRTGFGLAAGALRSVVRDAEIDRAAAGVGPAYRVGLSMQALPMVIAADPTAHRTAIELLDRADGACPA